MNALLLLLIIGISLSTCSVAQSDGRVLWSDIPEEAFAKKDGKKSYVKQYRTLTLDTAALGNLLATVSEKGGELRSSESTIRLPLPDGTLASFRFVFSPAMAPELSAQHADMRTYMGKGIDNPQWNVAFDSMPSGFHAMIATEQDVIYLEPYQPTDPVHYICYYKRDLVPAPRKPFETQGPIKEN